MHFDLVIQGGSIVTADSVVKTDLAILDGRIAAWGEQLQAKQIYAADDMLVLPGAVDAHVHLEMPTATTRTSDDWSSGTLAAVCGGTTTVIDFVEPDGDETLLDALQMRQKQANGHTYVDYGLHMTLTNAKEKTLRQIPAVIKEGVTSFKTYTTYAGFGLNDPDLISVFAAVAAEGGLVLVHSENDAIIQFCTEQLAAEQKLEPQYYPLSRPALAEIEAIQRVIQFAKLTGVSLYLVHVSTAGGVEAVERAQLSGQAVYAETCPQYLLLDESEFHRMDPRQVLKYVCSPPLRTQADQDVLWTKLSSGVLQTICTDHCAFNVEGQKDAGLDNFLNIPGGLPGVEMRLGLIHTYGVGHRNMSLSQWVSLCSTNPAKIFGLFPQKGHLEVGADADIIIFDPNLDVVISKEDSDQSIKLHKQVDHTPYEGWQLQGWPVATFLRGELIAKNQRLVADRPTGRFLHRERIKAF